MIATCQRCGIERTANESRVTNALCLDCRVVEREMEADGAARELAGLLDQRARIDERIRDLRPKVLVSGFCGTETGYTYHRRNEEPTCELCRAAHAQAQRRRNKRRLLRAMREAS